MSGTLQLMIPPSPHDGDTSPAKTLARNLIKRIVVADVAGEAGDLVVEDAGLGVAALGQPIVAHAALRARADSATSSIRARAAPCPRTASSTNKPAR